MPPLRPHCSLTRLSVMSQAVLLCAELYVILSHQQRLQGQTGPAGRAQRAALEARFQAFCRMYSASAQAWYVALRAADPAAAARLTAIWARYGIQITE